MSAFIEGKAELLELLANKADGEYADFLHYGITVAHVVCDFFNDSLPFVAGDLNAAQGCDYLHKSANTLAAALRMGLCWSIMMPSTLSLIADLFGGVRLSQRNEFSLVVDLVLMDTERSVPADCLRLLSRSLRVNIYAAPRKKRSVSVCLRLMRVPSACFWLLASVLRVAALIKSIIVYKLSRLVVPYKEQCHSLSEWQLGPT